MFCLQNFDVNSFYHILYKVAIILLTIVVGKLVIWGLRKIFGRIFNRSRLINDLMAKFLLKVISSVGWVIIALVVLRQLGVNMAPLLAGLGITGF
ncbi:MAG TPA: hypothetical protein GXZ38_07255, partial [Spirochaetales bacterium]|nr:hypothetical protein [Spirochaetales bacterium]